MDHTFPLYVPPGSLVSRGQHPPLNSGTTIPQPALQASSLMSFDFLENPEPVQQHLQNPPNIPLQPNYGNSLAPEPLLQDNSVPFPNNIYNFHPQLMPSSYADPIYDSVKPTAGPTMEYPGDVHVEPVKKCRWEGCKYSGSFGRDTDLLRHVKAVHISPGAYPCPSAGCGKSFGREDVMKAHQRTHKGTGVGMSSHS